MILKRFDVKERVAVVCKLIDIGEASLTIRNFVALNEVCLRPRCCRCFIALLPFTFLEIFVTLLGDGRLVFRSDCALNGYVGESGQELSPETRGPPQGRRSRHRQPSGKTDLAALRLCCGVM